jgi:hypothetical protein
MLPKCSSAKAGSHRFDGSRLTPIMNYLTESHGFTRPPSLLYRILRGIGWGVAALFIVLFDTVILGKSAADQMEDK